MNTYSEAEDFTRAETEEDLTTILEANKPPITTVVANEVLAIHKSHNGVALAEDILKAAQDPDSVLHPYFTWDDTVAGARFRLIEAQQLKVQAKYFISQSAPPIVLSQKDFKSTQIPAPPAWVKNPSGNGTVLTRVLQNSQLDSYRMFLSALKDAESRIRTLVSLSTRLPVTKIDVEDIFFLLKSRVEETEAVISKIQNGN